MEEKEGVELNEEVESGWSGKSEVFGQKEERDDHKNKKDMTKQKKKDMVTRTQKI
jgi:hypothetical protein